MLISRLGRAHDIVETGKKNRMKRTFDGTAILFYIG